MERHKIGDYEIILKGKRLSICLPSCSDKRLVINPVSMKEIVIKQASDISFGDNKP